MDVWNKFKFIADKSRIWKVQSDGAVTTSSCSGDGDLTASTCRSLDHVTDGSQMSDGVELFQTESDECLSVYDVEEASCEEDDEKREEGERIAQVEMMLDSSAKVIDRLTSQLQVGFFQYVFF